jgi:hypothetical protein
MTLPKSSILSTQAMFRTKLVFGLLLFKSLERKTTLHRSIRTDDPLWGLRRLGAAPGSGERISGGLPESIASTS